VYEDMTVSYPWLRQGRPLRWSVNLTVSAGAQVRRPMERVERRCCGGFRRIAHIRPGPGSGPERNSMA
jgi:hypothetical protein